jgi:diguanylate cyclase (GGDEF)-like protein
VSRRRTQTQTQALQLPEAFRSRGGPRQPVLVVVQGEEIGRRYPLETGRLVVGRDEDRVDIAIADPSVSARHALLVIDPENDRYGIVDLGSRNGTYVNGSPVETGALHDGDKIFLGTTVLKFTFHDSIEEQFHGEIERLMHLDSLSGLYVRRWFDQEFPRAFARARDGGGELSVAMMDLDGLKAINDRHGHQLGSHCIAEVGRHIKASLPAGASAARFGGDEFVAWLPGGDLGDALATAERIRRRVEEADFRRGAIAVAPTISIGVASFGPDVQGPDDLLRRADEALYRAKKAGRNAVSR